jgi:hypothetical protein
VATIATASSPPNLFADGRVRSWRYAAVVVSVDELRVSIERHLDDLSHEAERLRAALEALGPGDMSSAMSSIGETSRSSGSRRRRTDTRGATQHAAREALADGPALTAEDIAATMWSRRPTIAAKLSTLPSDPGRTAEDCAAGAARRRADRAYDGR